MGVLILHAPAFLCHSRGMVEVFFMVCDELRRNVTEQHRNLKENDVARMKGLG